MRGSLVPIPFYRLGPAGRQPGQGEHGQGDVGVPGQPGPDLVVIQPGLALGLMETLLPVLLIGAGVFPEKITAQGWRAAPSRQRRERSERP